jgi:two-component system response regulator NreC
MRQPSAETMNRIRVLLAEDHETVRQGLRLLLDTQSDIEVVAEAANGRTAVECSRDYQPNVVNLDISMPEMNGLAAARAIRDAAPSVGIVALTRHDDEAFVQELMSAGANAYVLKQSQSGELLNAVRAVARGEHYLDATLAARAAPPVDRRTVIAGRSPHVSYREREVLRLMAVGHSNKETAARLGISVKTVEVHKSNAMRKLALKGRTDVIRYAVLHGWLQEP